MWLESLWSRLKLFVLSNLYEIIAYSIGAWVVGTVGLTISVAVRCRRHARRLRDAGVDETSPGCGACLYPIRGNTTSTCTECGGDLAASGVRVGVSTHLAVKLYLTLFWSILISSAVAVPSSMWLLDQGTTMIGVSDASSMTPPGEPQFQVQFHRRDWTHLPLAASRSVEISIVGHGTRRFRFGDATEIAVAELAAGMQAVDRQMTNAAAQRKAQALADQIAAWETGMPLQQCLPAFGRPDFARRAAITRSIRGGTAGAAGRSPRAIASVPQWLQSGPHQRHTRHWVWLGVPVIAVVTCLGLWWVIRRHRPGLRPYADFVATRPGESRRAA